MPGRSKVTTDEEGRSALRALARSARRSEADRARAILLTLAGQRAAEIAAGLGVHVSTVREWRGLFARGGVAALQHRRGPSARGAIGGGCAPGGGGGRTRPAGRPAARRGSAGRPRPWPR